MVYLLLSEFADVALDAGVLSLVFGLEVVDVLDIVHQIVVELDVIVETTALSVELDEVGLPLRP